MWKHVARNLPKKKLSMNKLLTIGLLFSALFIRGCGVARAEVSEIVLQTIAMEAADQPLAGQIAVAHVILNRARIGHISPQEAVLRPKHFSCWTSPKWAKTWLEAHYTPKTRQNALSALNKAIGGSRNNLTHYHHVSIKPYWAKGHTPRLVIWNHAFYEGIN